MRRGTRLLSCETTASSQAIHSVAARDRTWMSGSSIIREYAWNRPEISGVLSVGSRYEPARPAKSRNRAHASGKNRPTPRYSQSSSSRRVDVTLSMSIPLTRSGCRSAYASDSVTPHDRPSSSHFSTPRCSRSCSMSLSRCPVVFRLMLAAGSLACGRLRPQLRWSKMMIRNFPGSNDLRSPAVQPDPGPPCTISTGTPSAFPQVSQYTRFPSPVSSRPVSYGSISGYLGTRRILLARHQREPDKGARATREVGPPHQRR
jgi:hypothetical protein